MLPFELTKDTPYLALSGELWSVFYEYFNRNWSCYKGFLLYIYIYIPDSGTHGCAPGYWNNPKAMYHIICETYITLIQIISII